jgi:hypothetical protein
VDAPVLSYFGSSSAKRSTHFVTYAKRCGMLMPRMEAVRSGCDVARRSSCVVYSSSYAACSQPPIACRACRGATYVQVEQQGGIECRVQRNMLVGRCCWSIVWPGGEAVVWLHWRNASTALLLEHTCCCSDQVCKVAYELLCMPSAQVLRARDACPLQQRLDQHQTCSIAQYWSGKQMPAYNNHLAPAALQCGAAARHCS